MLRMSGWHTDRDVDQNQQRTNRKQNADARTNYVDHKTCVRGSGYSLAISNTYTRPLAEFLSPPQPTAEKQLMLHTIKRRCSLAIRHKIAVALFFIAVHVARIITQQFFIPKI